ncbi:hypothetical protein D3C87_1549760 [compost metagenome]
MLDLGAEINAHLAEVHARNLPLSPREENHLKDFYEPNYVETSLLPALAIYRMESINGIEHLEFSEDTARLIESKLSEIEKDSFESLVSNNQSDLWEQRLTIEINDVNLARQLNQRASQRLTIS